MKNFAKSAAAVIVAAATLATALPASAQVWGNGPRGDYRYDRDGRDWRDGRWNDNRRDGRRWNDNRRWRQQCWIERRWDPYRHRRVNVRVCRWI